MQAPAGYISYIYPELNDIVFFYQHVPISKILLIALLLLLWTRNMQMN